MFKIDISVPQHESIVGINTSKFKAYRTSAEYVVSISPKCHVPYFRVEILVLMNIYNLAILEICLRNVSSKPYDSGASG